MKANNITLRQLRAFVAVSDHESFVAASKAIGLSQPALSQSVRQLEEELGARLFVRTTRSVHLTGVGLSFLTHARHVLRLMDEITADMEKIIERRSGRIVVACLPSTAWRLMPPVLAESAKLFPETRIVVRDMSMRGIKRAILSGEADIGIGSLTGNMSKFSSMVVVLDRMHVLFPRGHPFQRSGSAEWSGLAGTPFVGMTEETGIRQIVDEVSTANGLTLNYTAEVSNFATLMGLVEQGAGVTAVPGLALPRADHPVLCSRRIEAPAISREIALIWRHSSMVSPEAVRLLKSLEAVRSAGSVEGEGTAFEWRDFNVPSEI